jgi:hypothetical protein
VTHPLVIKRPERDASSNVDVKNAWRCTSFPAYALMTWCFTLIRMKKTWYGKPFSLVGICVHFGGCVVTESFLDRCYIGIGEHLRAVGIYNGLLLRIRCWGL